MSAISRSIFRATASTRAAAVSARPLSTSAVRAASKETAPQDAARAEEIEKHTREQQQHAKKGTNEWKHELASDSEASVKADQDQSPTTPEGIKKLQEETAGKK